MYADFYKLKKEAFHITPDPEFLFLSPSHKEALGSIIYGVDRRKGFVLVTGEVGVGKTTIIRSYLEQVDRRKLKIIYIFNSNVSFSGLLKTIFRELDAEAGTDDVFSLVNRLHAILIEQFRKGFNVVLIIDEAQNMPVETLENLRMLSNLETSTDKLIQIVFSGQPEFEQKLEMKQLRQLRQRVAVKATIRPLTADESLAYIRHRLAKASAENMYIFTAGALKRVVRHARGVPRIINILCENSLITALGYRKKQVTAGIVREVISDFDTGRRRPLSKKTLAAAVALVVLVCAPALYFYMDGPSPGTGKVKVAMPAPQSAAGVPVMTGDRAGDAIQGEAGKSPAPESSPPGPQEAAFPVVKVVRKGDTLSRLITDVYGSSSRKLIDYVKKNNNSINNVDLIEIGEKIIFPPREKSSGVAHE